VGTNSAWSAKRKSNRNQQKILKEEKEDEEEEEKNQNSLYQLDRSFSFPLAYDPRWPIQLLKYILSAGQWADTKFSEPICQSNSQDRMPYPHDTREKNTWPACSEPCCTGVEKRRPKPSWSIGQRWNTSWTEAFTWIVSEYPLFQKQIRSDQIRSDQDRCVHAKLNLVILLLEWSSPGVHLPA
jgi:hypothetical protein